MGDEHDPLGGLHELDDALLRLRPEVGVAGGEDLVEQQDVRVDRRRDREPEPGAHARRVGLDRRVDELAEVGVGDDVGEQLADDLVVEAEERTGEQDVLGPVSSWSKPAPSVSRLDTWPRTSTAPSDGVMIPARTWRSVLLPAPFGPMTPSDSPRIRVNDTWRSAQNSSTCWRETTCAIDWRSVVLRLNRRL